MIDRKEKSIECLREKNKYKYKLSIKKNNKKKNLFSS